MAYLTVTTQADVVDPSDGQLSLREAVAQANATAGADYIKFVVTLEGQTLVLTGGELPVTQDLTIDGDRNHDGAQITIDGNTSSRILNISGSGTDVMLRNLTIANGQSPATEDGGLVLMHGCKLSVVGSTLMNGTAGENRAGQGGAIAAEDNSKLIMTNSLVSGNSSKIGGGIFLSGHSTMVIDSSSFSRNFTTNLGDKGGGLALFDSEAFIDRSSVNKNGAADGAGIYANSSSLNVSNSTISSNRAAAGYEEGGAGAGTFINRGHLIFHNVTMTSNDSSAEHSYGGFGGGIFSSNKAFLDISDSIIVGNVTKGREDSGIDVFGSIGKSNGRNLLGTAVAGLISGDRLNVSANAVFEAIDPATGGGKLSPTGIVPLKSVITNPALSAADPITASNFGQLGTTKRPLPAGSLPDIGSIEINQPLSTSPTANNDVIIGSNAANNLSGLAGNDYLKGLGGNDTLNGGDGSDVLDGGPGNDKLNGGNGVDIITYAGTTAVVLDLSTNPATAKRGGETDTLTSIEGAIGSDKADSFKGDANNNEFQGGLGKDSYTGGGGRDLYAFKTVQDSPPGAGRDVIKDFVPGQDVIDVSDIDADSTTPGQQSFRWVGKATLTGAAQLGYYVSSGNTIIRASNNADAAAEVEIQLTGVKSLTEGDFRL